MEQVGGSKGGEGAGGYIRESATTGRAETGWLNGASGRIKGWWAIQWNKRAEQGELHGDKWAVR